MPPQPRIGVLGCFYNCAELLPQALAPWLELKAAGYPLVLGGINAQFAEYAELGYPNDDEATRAALERYKASFDVLQIEPKPLREPEVRAQLLRALLAHEVDLVWLLDGDEVYTRGQIENILAYIRATPQFDYYHVNFDNRVFGRVLEDDFYPPRIFRTERRGGLAGFADDNAVMLGDGRGLYESVPGIIPKRVAHVLHHTWRLADAAKKIAYQHKHFGFSAFRIDAQGAVSPDPALYAHLRRPAPTLAGERYVAAPKAPLRVFLELPGAGEPERRALVATLEALLAVERQNDYRIELWVRAPERARRDIEGLFAVCPFETRLTEEPPAPGEDVVVFQPSQAILGPKHLLKIIRARFPVLLG